MIQYILLTANIIIFTPLFSILIILVGVFDHQKIRTGYLVRLWAYLILKLSNIKYSVEGFDIIDPKKKYVIISNHQSAIDILLAFAIFPMPISFFTKKELFLIPVFGLAMKYAGMIPVDRHTKEKSKKSVDIAVSKAGSTQLSFLNYPEGTRMTFDRLGKFKKGGFLLAIKSGLPIVPLTLVYRKSLIRIVVGNSIDSLNYELSSKEILVKKTRDIIASHLSI